MQDKIDKPIFVVGSPRSGTSVLTWCLEQHPNMFALPESGWIGDLAIDLAIRYQIGTARGDLSLLGAMDVQREEFFAIFGSSINKLILNHRRDLDLHHFELRRLRNARSGAAAVPTAFSTVHSTSDPKARWVDGTPENSFHICGLRKLFPEARFIHLVRDVTSVVRSLLNFFPDGRNRLVANEQAAYDYWLRTVTACAKAERAYGPSVVYRLRYSDLTDRSESALRSLLNFLDEPYAAECLAPLTERINSSNVPADFKIGDPETDAAVVEQATRLCSEVEKTSQSPEASPAAAVEIETAFEKRVQYVATVDSEYQRALRIITTLQKETAQLTARCSDRQSDSKTE